MQTSFWEKIIKTVYCPYKCYNVDCDGILLAIGFPCNEQMIITDLEGNQINCFTIRNQELTLRNNEIYMVSKRNHILI